MIMIIIIIITLVLQPGSSVDRHNDAAFLDLLGFLDKRCFTVREESASGPATNWWISPPYLCPQETGWSSYTPGHWEFILVTSSNTHGLRWAILVLGHHPEMGKLLYY
jgi:hypothetical protein